MFEDVLVPLFLTERLGQVKGKTRFQKLMFLVEKLAEKEGIDAANYDFKIYLYGPYSHDLSRKIDDLVCQGFVDERTEQTSSNYEIHLFSLSSKGEEFLRDAKAKNLVSEDIGRIISEIICKYGQLSLPKLVQEAYSQF